MIAIAIATSFPLDTHGPRFCSLVLCLFSSTIPLLRSYSRTPYLLESWTDGQCLSLPSRLSFVIRRLSFAICRLSFAVCRVAYRLSNVAPLSLNHPLFFSRPGLTDFPFLLTSLLTFAFTRHDSWQRRQQRTFSFHSAFHPFSLMHSCNHGLLFFLTSSYPCRFWLISQCITYKSNGIFCTHNYQFWALNIESRMPFGFIQLGVAGLFAFDCGRQFAWQRGLFSFIVYLRKCNI